MRHRLLCRGAAVIAALKNDLKDNRKCFYGKTCRYFWRERKKAGVGLNLAILIELDGKAKR